MGITKRGGGSVSKKVVFNSIAGGLVTLTDGNGSPGKACSDLYAAANIDYKKGYTPESNKAFKDAAAEHGLEIVTVDGKLMGFSLNQAKDGKEGTYFHVFLKDAADDQVYDISYSVNPKGGRLGNKAVYAAMSALSQVEIGDHVDISVSTKGDMDKDGKPSLRADGSQYFSASTYVKKIAPGKEPETVRYSGKDVLAEGSPARRELDEVFAEIDASKRMDAPKKAAEKREAEGSAIVKAMAEMAENHPAFARNMHDEAHADAPADGVSYAGAPEESAEDDAKAAPAKNPDWD